MNIIHRGDGNYWIGKFIVIQAREGFFCIQFCLFGKWFSWGKLIDPPKYARYSHKESKMVFLTRREWENEK